MLQPFKQALFTTLLGANLPWLSARNLIEVSQPGVPALKESNTVQVVMAATPRGQGGGVLWYEFNVSLVMAVGMSEDIQGRIDALAARARNQLHDIQKVLEGNHLGTYLDIPLFTDDGPTLPEVFEQQPKFFLTLLNMSGQKIMPIAEWVVT